MLVLLAASLRAEAHPRVEPNLRTAKVLGLTIPPSVLVRADEIIE